MKTIICCGLFVVLLVNSAAGTVCDDEIKKCANAYTTASAQTKTTDDKCTALILEYQCLKLADTKFCNGAEQQTVDDLLNKKILPTLISDCPEQLCEADLLGCNQQWQTNTTRDVNNPQLKCRDAAAFEACLNGISSTCTPAQQSQIQATLQQIRPQIKNSCKNEDCQVQAEQCKKNWGVPQTTKQAECVFAQGLEVCLEDIETECSPDQKKQMDLVLKDAKATLTTNCKGQGCSPKEIQCVTNWNTSVQAAGQDKTKMCAGENGFVNCLTAALPYCATDQATEINTDLKTAKPRVQQACGGSNAVHPLTFYTMAVGAVLILRHLF